MSNSNTNLFDTDTSNYSLAELMAISDINDLDPQEIVTKTNKYIHQFKDKNPTLAIFFVKFKVSYFNMRVVWSL